MTDLQDDLELLRDHRSDLNGDDRDRIAAEIERLQKQLHYATGTCDLAMKHRDSAEAQNERLTAERDDAREQRRKWQEASVADRAENERLRADVRKAFNAGFWAWAGPANDAEVKAWEADEEQAWVEWSANNVPEQLPTKETP